jgi:hypothetical protein
MKKVIPIIVAVAAAWFITNGADHDVVSVAPAVPTKTAAPSSFASGSQVEGSGAVTRILPDDNNGSRHQRFILELASGQTVLVAHNIDLAPRIAGIQPGDLVEFNGEYEVNPQGGVIHWTHHDPQGRHAGGWLKHEGKTYQ